MKTQTREIKFRAWDIEREEMLPMDLFKEEWLDPHQPYWKTMQFTGLLDKHGVEIYEGDIVRTDSDANMKVCWRYDFACFCLRFNKGSSSNIDGAVNYEVIGNIFENEDLLE